MEDLLEMVRRALANVVLPLRRRLSRVRIDGDEVRVRNFPSRERRVPIERVDRFDWSETDEGRVAVLHVADGVAMPVVALNPSHPGAVPVLNNAIRAK